MLNKFVFFYIWMTFPSFSKTKHGHVQHVQCVLQRLLENRLFIKVEKCKLHLSDWPVPSSHEQLQHSPGFPIFYQRFTDAPDEG